MTLAKITSNIALVAVALGIAGNAFAATPPAKKVAAKKPAAQKSTTKATYRAQESTTSTSSNILPVASVSPSFYVIGAPVMPDPVEPNMAPESRAGYSILPATPTLNASTPEQGATVPGTIQAAIGIEPEYAVLNRLIVYSGLVSELRKPGPWTLLAPTNSAFAKLPQGALDDLLLPENHDKLVAIVKAHFISGEAKAAQIGGMTSAATWNGNSFPVTSDNGSIMIGGAKVVKSDVTCANGVIHTIDTVLMP